MIRTKAYLIREITRLKKQKAKLAEELHMLKAYNNMAPEFKKSISIISKEIEKTSIKIETIHWVANTSEKQLPKIKKKKKKIKKSNNEDVKKKV